MEKTWENVSDLRLDVRLPAGRVDVETTETDRVELRLEALTDAARELIDDVLVELRPRGDGHELLVEVPERRTFGWILGRGPEFALELRCPHGARAAVRSGSADFRARGSLGALELKTASGDVEAERVDGDATVHTASGDVSLDTVLGEAGVHTASGDVELGHVGGPLRANLVSGDLALRAADGSVRVHSVSGDQRVEAVRRGPVELQSVSGDIEVGIRRGTNVWLDVRSVSGDTTSALTPSEAPEGGGDEPVLELRVKSVSGDVRIEQAPAGNTPSAAAA